MLIINYKSLAIQNHNLIIDNYNIILLDYLVSCIRKYVYVYVNIMQFVFVSHLSKY